MSKLNNLYVGKAGQSHAMSEFLIRGWNVAIPEVDIGDDIFVVKDGHGEFSRVQVKTANAVARREGFSAQFSLPYLQLLKDDTPELTYFFLTRFNNQWQQPLLINRANLLEEVRNQQVGAIAAGKVMLYFSFQKEKVTCSSVDFTSWLNNFEDFPVLLH